MKALLSFALCLSLFFLSAQQPEGITNHQTRAVVIGISDYQDPAIPDLRFADRDADAFFNFLRSPGGGSLREENLKFLTNQHATAGQVISALTWLLDESKPGDQAIIYFSGHGDVEAKLLNQLGFLLLWDSPAHAYLAGALPVDMLRQVVTTLSVEQQTKVFIVVDACRAGKLAGNTVVGTQLTSSQLAKQFSQERKILSCQPNEFSIEGEQWGGGRGVFSYHLCNGLYGLADANGDGQVSLFEINRYLEDHVPPEVAPLSQMPLTVGDKKDALFSVDGPTLAALQKRGAPPPVIAAVEQRGLLHEVLSKADTSVRFWYAGFERALRDKRFFEPAGDCAEAFFQKLMGEESAASLQPMLRRNYAAALQDDAQQAINIWLKADVQQLKCIGKSLKLNPIPQLLKRAAELLGEENYMYRSLLARKLLFEGIVLMQHDNPDEALGRKCLALFRQSLALEPQSPLPWHRMSFVYAENLLRPDSAFVCARKARELAPNWVLPMADLGYILSQHDLAKQALEEAEAIDPQHPYVINRWAVWLKNQPGKANLEQALALFEKYRANGGPMYPCWYNDYANLLSDLGRYAEAEQQYRNAIALDSMNASPWSNIGTMYLQTYRYAETELALKKAIALDSAYILPWRNLGYLYIQTGRYTEAEPLLKKAILLDSTYVLAWRNLGELYLLTHRYPEAEPVLKKAIRLDSTTVVFWSNLGYLYNQTGRYTEAEPVLKKAIGLDSTRAVDWYNLGQLYLQVRRYAEAEPVLKKATALNPTSAQLWDRLGYLYTRTRRYDEGEQVLKKALALDSTFAISWNNLGNLYLQTRRFTEAEPVLQKAVALDPTNANSRKHLGMVCFKTNRPEEARQHFLKALELKPKHAPATLGMAYLSAATMTKADGDMPASARAAAGKEALGFVEQAIGKGSTFEDLESDEDLAPLHTLPEWKALMKKYFPDKVKD